VADTLQPLPSPTEIPVAGLRVIPRRYDGGIDVFLHGELDLCTVGDLDAEMRALSYQYDACQVVIDVSRLTFIDVRGADAFRRLANLWRDDERVTIRGDAPLLEHLLQVVGCADRFERIDAG